MIMQRQPDGTYTQIGFIRTPTEDIDKIVDKNGDVYFTKGFTRQIAGTPPLSLNAIGKPIISYKIYGNIIQNGTPSPESPVEVLGCGNRTRNLLNRELMKIGAISPKIGYPVTVNSDYPYSRAFEIHAQPNIKYTFSLHTNIDTSVYRVVEADENDVMLKETLVDTVKGVNIKVAITFQTMANTRKIYVQTRIENIDSTQLELGTEVTPYIPYGYEIPVVTRSENQEPVTTNIFLDKPLYKGDYITKDKSGGRVHREWGVDEPTTESIDLPEIPTFKGTTIIETATEIPPSNIETTYKARKEG